MVKLPEGTFFPGRSKVMDFRKSHDVVKNHDFTAHAQGPNMPSLHMSNTELTNIRSIKI